MDEFATDLITERVFAYCTHLMTPEEKMAEQCAVQQEAVERLERQMAARLVERNGVLVPKNKRDYAQLERYWRSAQGFLNQHLTPVIAERIQNGRKAFRDGVRDRLLREHRAEVLNLCPRCGAVTRTPRARQCPECFYDWHGE